MKIEELIQTTINNPEKLLKDLHNIEVINSDDNSNSINAAIYSLSDHPAILIKVLKQLKDMGAKPSNHSSPEEIDCPYWNSVQIAINKLSIYKDNPSALFLVIKMLHEMGAKPLNGVGEMSISGTSSEHSIDTVIERFGAQNPEIAIPIIALLHKMGAKTTHHTVNIAIVALGKSTKPKKVLDILHLLKKIGTVPNNVDSNANNIGLAIYHLKKQPDILLTVLDLLKKMGARPVNTNTPDVERFKKYIASGPFSIFGGHRDVLPLYKPPVEWNIVNEAMFYLKDNPALLMAVLTRLHNMGAVPVNGHEPDSDSVKEFNALVGKGKFPSTIYYNSINEAMLLGPAVLKNVIPQLQKMGAQLINNDSKHNNLLHAIKSKEAETVKILIRAKAVPNKQCLVEVSANEYGDILKLCVQASVAMHSLAANSPLRSPLQKIAQTGKIMLTKKELSQLKTETATPDAIEKFGSDQVKAFTQEYRWLLQQSCERNQDIISKL